MKLTHIIPILLLTIIAQQTVQATNIEILPEASPQAEFPLHNPQADYPGSPELPLTAVLIDQLHKLNSDGKIYEVWALLAGQKDGYAQSAVRIFGEKLTLQKCTVVSNWKVVVGDEVRAQHFDRYAQVFQQHYISFLNQNHKYPNTVEIEKMYQQTNADMHLPQRISVDLMFNTIPENWDLRQFLDELGAVLGFGRYAKKMRWYHYIDISEARTSTEMVKIEGASVAEMKKNYKATSKEIARCMFRKLKASAPTAAVQTGNQEIGFGY